MEISIETQNIRKEYPSRLALSDISFKVAKGSIHGFLGPNGAGKTTTMKILTGLINQSSGHFKVNGRIGFLPENPPLYLNMTVDDYLMFVEKIYNDNSTQSNLLKVKEQCGLTEVGDRLIGNLSKGFKQRVGIAQALIHNPEIIILDEPTVGLDPVAIVEIRKLIESLKGKHTVLFSSHQLHEVELLCEEITLVDKGQVLVSGTIDEIQKKLTTKKQFRALVKSINEELLAEIKKFNKIDSIEFGTDHELIIYCRPDFDSVDDVVYLTSMLSKKEIGLINFREEKLDLEEIFKRMTYKKEIKK